MFTRYLLFLLFVGSLLQACGSDSSIVDDTNDILSSEIVLPLSVRGITSYASETDENRINTVNIFSFVQKPGETVYTYEKRFTETVTSGGNAKAELSLTLDGTLPRILYFVANNVSNIPFLTDMRPGTPATSVDEEALLMDSDIPQAPFTLVSKVQLDTPYLTTNLPVEFTHTVSRLDIVNNYKGFEIDSMIVRNATLGTYAFNESLAADELPHIDQKYTSNPIYLYHSSSLVLSVYGKYNGIRAVFDIDLKEIKKATRYNVVINSLNDQEQKFTGNFYWEVVPWTEEIVESTPDWK